MNYGINSDRTKLFTFLRFSEDIKYCSCKNKAGKNLRETIFQSMKSMQKDHELNYFQETQDKQNTTKSLKS